MSDSDIVNNVTESVAAADLNQSVTANQLSAHIKDIAEAVRSMPIDPLFPLLQPRALVVGSYALNRNPNARDVDIEVHGVSSSHLASQIGTHPQLAGKIESVEYGGNAYVVAFVKLSDGCSVNFSVPIRERENPKRYDESSVSQDPALTFEQAVLRRDFTINALGFDPITNEILDPLGGMSDQENGILRPVNPNFHCDPIRLPRTLRLLAESGFKPHADLDNVLRRMALSPGDLSPKNFQSDRYAYEISRFFVSDIAPSKCLGVADKYGMIEVDLPELAVLKIATFSDPQETIWDWTLARVDVEWSAAKQRMLPEPAMLANQIGALYAGMCRAKALLTSNHVAVSGALFDQGLAGLIKRTIHSALHAEVVPLTRSAAVRILDVLF